MMMNLVNGKIRITITLHALSVFTDRFMVLVFTIRSIQITIITTLMNLIRGTTTGIFIPVHGDFMHQQGLFSGLFVLIGLIGIIVMVGMVGPIADGIIILIINLITIMADITMVMITMIDGTIAQVTIDIIMGAENSV